MKKSELLLQLLITISIPFLLSRPLTGVYARFESTTIPTAANTQTQAPVRVKVAPLSITFPSIGLTLPIASGIIQNNKWTLYDDKASWLSTSEMPEFGNVIIYAHNRKGLFAGLKYLNMGDTIIINSEGQEYHYLVSEIKKITPTNVDAVISDAKRLTLYTCDGAFDQKRLLVVGKPSF